MPGTSTAKPSARRTASRLKGLPSESDLPRGPAHAAPSRGLTARWKRRRWPASSCCRFAPPPLCSPAARGRRHPPTDLRRGHYSVARAKWLHRGMLTRTRGSSVKRLYATTRPPSHPHHQRHLLLHSAGTAGYTLPPPHRRRGRCATTPVAGCRRCRVDARVYCPPHRCR